jgi:putative membrane protein
MDTLNYYWGMHIAWWFVWVFMILWIFAFPYEIPGQRYKKESPLNLLKRRLAKGQITNEDFFVMKEMLESDLTEVNGKQ